MAVSFYEKNMAKFAISQDAPLTFPLKPWIKGV
jgi:hypothetical protein